MKRLKKVASVETVVEAIKKAFDEGYYEVEQFQNGGRYGMRWTLKRGDISEFLQTEAHEQVEATPEEFAAAGNTFAKLDPAELPTLVCTSKETIIDDICSTYEIGASDKDFSGGVEVSGDELHIDLYLM